MDQKRKKHIDSLWMKTDLGRFVLACAAGKEAEAVAIKKKVLTNYPFSFAPMEKELSKILAAEVKDENEWKEYLETLDAADSDLVAFMISDDTFGCIYDLLK